jgi:hypothetical protein
MDANINKHLHNLFDANNEALQAMRDANRYIGIANNAFVDMLAAHDAAITAAMKANRAAIDLLAALNSDGQS